MTRKAGGLRELRNVSGNRPRSYDCKEVSSANDLHELGCRLPAGLQMRGSPGKHTAGRWPVRLRAEKQLRPPRIQKADTFVQC